MRRVIPGRSMPMRSALFGLGILVFLLSCKTTENQRGEIVEQDHRRVRQRTRPMLGFKTFMSAAKTIAGIEIVAMIKKGQLDIPGSTPFEQFYALAG